MKPTRARPRPVAGSVCALLATLMLGACQQAESPDKPGVMAWLRAVITQVLSEKGRSPANPAAMAGGPPPVTAAAAILREVTESDEFAGRFEATQRVDVRARVYGYLKAIHFTPGTEVAAGDLLYEIDPAPIAARLTEAEAAAGNTRAQLVLARTELERQKKMLPQHATSRRDYDAAVAAVATLEATARSDEARIATAKVDLGYTRITAPIAGRIGKDEITIGNLVRGDAPDSPVLTTLVAVDPVYVTFEADETTYLKYLSAARAQSLRVEVGLGNEQGTPHQAQLKFIDNQLNIASGTVRLRAELPNPERRFTPGLYARVKLSSGAGTHPAVMVQDSAIGTDQSKRFVLVLDQDKKAQYREVKPGRAYDGLRAIESGLKAGEVVVINGLQRVRPGSPVTPQMTDMAPPVGSPEAKPAAAAQDIKPAAAGVPESGAAPVAKPAPATTASPVSAPAAKAVPAASAQAAGSPGAVGHEDAPAAKPAAPTETRPHPDYSAEWLLKQSPNTWVVQLLGTVDETAATRFIKQHGLAGQAAVIASRHEDKPWFLVVYGLYPDADSARRAVDGLPPALVGKTPAWPRSLKSLAGQMR